MFAERPNLHRVFLTLVGPNYFWAEIVYFRTLLSGTIESFGKLRGNTQYISLIS